MKLSGGFTYLIVNKFNFQLCLVHFTVLGEKRAPVSWDETPTRPLRFCYLAYLPSRSSMSFINKPPWCLHWFLHALKPLRLLYIMKHLPFSGLFLKLIPSWSESTALASRNRTTWASWEVIFLNRNPDQIKRQFIEESLY